MRLAGLSALVGRRRLVGKGRRRRHCAEQAGQESAVRRMGCLSRSVIWRMGRGIEMGGFWQVWLNRQDHMLCFSFARFFFIVSGQ